MALNLHIVYFIIRAKRRMFSVKNQQTNQGVGRFIRWQCVLTALLATLAYFITGMHAMVSAASGGLISIVSTMCFAWCLFRYKGAQKASAIATSFYKGEALKIACSALLFTIAFVVIKVQALVFFATYIAVQWLFWFAPRLMKAY